MIPTRSSRSVRRRAGALALVAALALAACGGDDDESGSTDEASEEASTEGTSGGDTTGDTTAEDTDTDEADTEATTPEETVDESGDDDSSGAESGGDGTPADGSIEERCASLVTLDEAQAIIGEPTEFAVDESSTNDDLGQTLCVWGTIEDPNDAEDLASQSLILQYYDGTIPGPNFYDPEMTYPDAEPLDIGDEGFIDVTDGGVDIGWVDGDTATFMAWFSIDLSDNPDAPTGESRRDPMIELANSVNERS